MSYISECVVDDIFECLTSEKSGRRRQGCNAVAIVFQAWERIINICIKFDPSGLFTEGSALIVNANTENISVTI